MKLILTKNMAAKRPDKSAFTAAFWRTLLLHGPKNHQKKSGNKNQIYYYTITSQKCYQGTHRYVFATQRGRVKVALPSREYGGNMVKMDWSRKSLGAKKGPDLRPTP
jgi:hypothetical protein